MFVKCPKCGGMADLLEWGVQCRDCGEQTMRNSEPVVEETGVSPNDTPPPVPESHDPRSFDGGIPIIAEVLPNQSQTQEGEDSSRATAAHAPQAVYQRRRSTRRRTPQRTLKIAMLCVTVAWPIFAYAWASWESNRVYAGVVSEVRDNYIISTRGGQRMVDGWVLRAAARRNFNEGFISVTVIYGVIMVVLGVTFFYYQPDSRAGSH